MNITVEQVQGKEAVTILGLQGNLDASNFEDVIAEAQEIYKSGGRNILFDMNDVDFMSSSGLVALHSIALLMRGDQPHDLEAGWDVFHAIDRDRDSGLQEHVKLLNPQPKVALTLEKTGMDKLFEIHTDRQTAIDSF
jgi:anti-anti-sigma regulatory factor